VSRGARIGVLVAAVVGLIVGFVLVSPGGDDRSDRTSPPTSAPAPPTATTGTRPAPAQPPAAAFTTIRVQGGKPVGGVKTVTVEKGDRARIEVTSPDTSGEVHLHGYDIMRDLKAGGRVRFSFDADAEGIFEMELESSHTQIAKLVVEPR
jgi:hypothetical protein